MNSGNDSGDFPPGEGGKFPPGEGGGAAGAPHEGGDDTPLNTGRPAVAAAPGKLIFVILFAGIFIFIIVRSLFFGPPPEVKEQKHGKERVTASNTRGEGGELSISPGALPGPPADLINANNSLPPPPPPPPPPPLLTGPTVGLNNAPTNEALSKRIHSAMLVGGGGARPGGITKRKSAISAGNDPNSAFAENLGDSHAQEAIAGKLENLDFTILQGKLIHAVLESAIDSQLPSPIRAVVSHDVYAEVGREILIPKGSRIIGTYNSSIRKDQARVFIVWQRVIRPDGIDIFVDSTATDLLGRGGIAGDVDRKYFEMFSSAILVSAMDIGVAAVGDALFGNQQTTTTSNSNGTSTSQSPTSVAMQQAVATVGSIGQGIVSGLLNLSPEIFIDQGTPVNIFVNRDLIFPREVLGNGGFIQ